MVKPEPLRTRGGFFVLWLQMEIMTEFEELTPDQLFEIRNGVHPLKAFDDLGKKELYMQYYLEYGPYELLALLHELQGHFQSLEDYLKCANIRTLKLGLLQGLHDFEFKIFEDGGGITTSIPSQTIIELYEEE